jgi:hypothetical protein
MLIYYKQFGFIYKTKKHPKPINKQLNPLCLLPQAIGIQPLKLILPQYEIKPQNPTAILPAFGGQNGLRSKPKGMVGHQQIIWHQPHWQSRL